VTARVRYCVGAVGHSRPAEYALRSLLEIIVPPDCLVLGTGAGERHDDEVLVTYQTALEDFDSGVRIFASGFFDNCYGSIDAMPKRPVVRIDNIPALYRDARGSAGAFYNSQDCAPGARIDCHVDVVAGTFFMLSRYEETIVQAVDVFDRFAAESSVAYQEGFLQEPVVSQYAEQLLKMLRIAGFTGERRRWWETAPWAIALTHDVDKIHRFPMSVLDIGRYVLGRVPTGTPKLGALLRDYVQTTTNRKTDEYDCLREMAAWEASTGVSASYYFLGDSRGRHGADYSIDEKRIVADVQAVAAMGHEIGFHAGMGAFDDARRFHGELSRVRMVGTRIAGGRQHYLRWKTPLTWRLWEHEGLAYDTTLGYSKAGGFRCGTCHPFRPYDIENDREMSLWEWPLMFMDATYRMSWSGGMAVLQHLSQQCSQHGGVLVLLWHSANWSELYASPIRHHLQKLIVDAVARGAVVDSIASLMELMDSAAERPGATETQGRLTGGTPS
jgi:hypothetical protein